MSSSSCSPTSARRESRWHIDILKPELEAAAGVRIDAGHRYVEPLRESLINIPSDPAASGEPWFDSIEFIPGERKKLAGRFVAKLSPAAMATLADLRWAGTVPVAVSEFRRLSTVAGFVLYLRCRDLIQHRPAAVETTLRWTDEHVHAAFGNYCGGAVNKRTLANGDVSQTISLSRLTRLLIEPGIGDIQRNVDDLLIGLDIGRQAEAGRGKAWRRIDIVFGPRPETARRPTLRELNDQTAARLGYDRTKHSRLSDPATR